jgi:hypothetical protein
LRLFQAKKSHQDPNLKARWEWWYTSVITSIWEAEVRGSLGKSIRPYLKNKQKEKGLGALLKQ